MITGNFVRSCYGRLVVIDAEHKRDYFAAQPKYKTWAAGADAGNKGREVVMIAISHWDEKKNAPEYVGVAAAERMKSPR